MPSDATALGDRIAGLLQQREKLFPDGSLRRRYALASFWSIAGSVLSRVLNLAAWIAGARVLGKSAFGQFSLVQSTAGVFGALAGLGLGLTATKFVAECRHSNPERAGRIVALATLLATGCGAIAALLLVGFASMIAGRVLGDGQLSGCLVIAAGLVFFGAVNGCQTGTLAGFEAFRTMAAVNFATGIAAFPAMLAGVLRGGLKGALWASVGVLVFNWLLNHVAVRHECKKAGVEISFAGCRREAGVLFHFSLPALLTSASISPALWLCNAWLARQPNGYAELGIYGAADRWRLAILFVPASLFTTVLPMLSNLQGNGDAAGFRRVFRANLLLNMALVVAPAVALVALCRPLMAVFGTGYSQGALVLAVLCVATVPEALNTILGQPLISRSMWTRFAFDVLLVVALVGGARVLIPRFGALGFAMAYAFAFTITAAALAWYMKSLVVGSSSGS